MNNFLKRLGRSEFVRRTAIILLIVLFGIIFFYKKIFIVIPAGHAGVLYDVFTGTDLNRTYGEGLHMISPLNTIVIYNVRTQRIDISQNVLSKNGLTIHVDYAVLFKPDRNLLPMLHQQVGTAYRDKVILPCVKSRIRKEIALLTPEQIYMMDRGVTEKNDLDTLNKILIKNQIVLEGYFISSITLPDSVNNAIASVYSRQQLSEEYNYRLIVEQKERERKAIEAEGLKDFISISGISPVQWKALDVTQKIATSPNSKMLIMGNGTGGLPIIMGDQFSAGTINKP
jgi:regulator of protease activity HflC (stomatin/prohibitin superfamily)